MTRLLRLAALGVMVGMLVLFVACLRQWSNMQIEIPRLDSHNTQSLFANKWFLSLLFLPSLLLSGLAISLLLLSAAARIAASQEHGEGQRPIGGGNTAAARLLSQLPNPVAMKALATALVLYGLLLLLLSIADPLVFQIVSLGFRMMFDLAGACGLIDLIGPLPTIAGLLLMALVITVLLYSDRPYSDAGDEAL